MSRPNRRPFGALATSTARTRTEYLVGTACDRHWRLLSHALVSLTALVWLSSVTPLHAQSASEVTQVWGAVGLGAGQAAGPYQGGGELAGLGEIVVQRGKQRFSIRAAGVTDIWTFSVGDIGLLYGHAWKGYGSQRSISAGIARVSSDNCPFDAKRLRCPTTIGFPLSAEVTWPSSWVRGLGFGLQAFGNINSVSNFAAVALTLRVGRLR